MSDSDQIIQDTIVDHLATVVRFQEQCAGVISAMAARTVECLRSGGKICFFGNGGSAADSQHFATEFVGISTSGNSANVVHALALAKGSGITTFAFTGQHGGACGEHADFLLSVPSPVTARVQECHLIAGHLLCDLAELAFADVPSTIFGN